jgi:hypothetical protein
MKILLHINFRKTSNAYRGLPLEPSPFTAGFVAPLNCQSVPILGNILGVTPWDSDIYSMVFESERRLGMMPVLTWKTPTPQAT